PASPEPMRVGDARLLEEMVVVVPVDEIRAQDGRVDGDHDRGDADPLPPPRPGRRWRALNAHDRAASPGETLRAGAGPVNGWKLRAMAASRDRSAERAACEPVLGGPAGRRRPCRPL